MARPAKFTHDELLDAAVRALLAHGPDVTIAQVAAAVGAPIGSVYHRVPSRDHLLASVWLRAIRRFHQGLLATSRIADPRQALLAQAVHQPRFCRAHPGEAYAMTLYGQQELLGSGPVELRDEISTVNDDIWALGRELASALDGRDGERGFELVAMAVWQTPYGMIRSFVRNRQPIPDWMDDAVVAAADAVLGLR